MVSAWCSCSIKGGAGVGTLPRSGKALGSSWAPSPGAPWKVPRSGTSPKPSRPPLCPHPAPTKTGRKNPVETQEGKEPNQVPSQLWEFSEHPRWALDPAKARKDSANGMFLVAKENARWRGAAAVELKLYQDQDSRASEQTPGEYTGIVAAMSARQQGKGSQSGQPWE